MAKKNIENIKLTNFPEEVTEDGIKIYGETSYENQMAVLSHFLHNHPKKLDRRQKEEIIAAVREFLSRKEFRQGDNDEELTDEMVLKAAESPLQYNLFSDFFDVPFPAPKRPKFTFIDLFTGVGSLHTFIYGMRGNMFSNEWKKESRIPY